MQFNRAIPGQSLTTPPKSAPYERPPQISDPLEAIDYHLEQLDDPKAVEELMFFLQLGIDLSTLVEGVARKAVLDGIHEYIKGYADALDIDYDEGFEDKEEENIMYGRRLLLAKKMLADQKERDFEYDEEAGLTKQEGMNFLDERGNIRMQNIPEVEPKGRVVDPDMPVEEDPVLEASNEPKGLMART